MSSSTRTGLIPTPKRDVRILQKKVAIGGETVGSHYRLPIKFESVPMPLSLRPYGGLYNPFAKGCSVLCNHPAPTAVKDVINQFKTSLAIEGKNVRYKMNSDQHEQHALPTSHESDNIPEDLFRRYTDTDSRPLTPTPTVTSVHTRTSAAGSFLNRRCITPEWGKHEITKRKKIILDLRRSHSQETLYWKPSSDLTQSGLDGDGDKKPKSAGANDEKKARRQKANDQQRPKSSLGMAVGHATQPVIAEISEADFAKAKMPVTCINEHGLGDDEDVRRGKKRKKLKSAPATTTFHLSEDPETQVATLGPDSLNPSTRPSLIPNCASLLPSKDPRETEPVLLKGSFLTDEAFQALKTELDVDVIENTFGRYLNRALREAIKYIPTKPKTAHKNTNDLEQPYVMCGAKMPRKLSKSATRFDVPLDLALLETMTPLDYLSQYVFVSQQRKQLFKRVFLKYLNKVEENDAADVDPQEKNNSLDDANAEDGHQTVLLPRREYVERTINCKNLPKALEDVLEFHGTERNINEVLRILDFKTIIEKDLTFRSWCGIVAFSERLALDDPTATDSCDELEKADFNSMEQLIANFKVPVNTRELFDIIQRAHNKQ